MKNLGLYHYLRTLNYCNSTQKQRTKKEWRRHSRKIGMEIIGPDRPEPFPSNTASWDMAITIVTKIHPIKKCDNLEDQKRIAEQFLESLEPRKISYLLMNQQLPERIMGELGCFEKPQGIHHVQQRAFFAQVIKLN